MLSTCGAGLKKTYFLLITTASYLKKKTLVLESLQVTIYAFLSDNRGERY